MQVIDMRQNPNQQMQMYQQFGETIGQAANGMRKLAAERKLTGIMANKDLTDEQRLNALTEAGGLWYVTGRDVGEYMQKPEVKQRFMEQHLGQNYYQQEYQAQAQQRMENLKNAIGIKNMLAGDQYRDANTGELTPEAQAMWNMANEQIQQVMPQQQQPTIAGQKAVQDIQSGNMAIQSQQQALERGQYEVSQRPVAEQMKALDLQSKQLQNELAAGNIDKQNYEVTLRDVAEQKAQLENQALEQKINELPKTGLSGKDKMDAEMSLRKEVNTNTTVKAYNVVKTYSSVIDEAMKALKRGERLAADETIIVGLKKMIEPDSVVRESEYARTPESVGYLDSLRGRLERLTDGGSGIPADKVKEIANLVSAIESVHKEAYDNAIAPYQTYADEYGLDSKLIFQDMETVKKKTPDEDIPEVDFNNEKLIKVLPAGVYIDSNTGNYYEIE